MIHTGGTLMMRPQGASGTLAALSPAGDLASPAEAVGRDMVVADVERTYTGPDGRSLRFHGPQFYRRRGENGYGKTENKCKTTHVIGSICSVGHIG